MAFRKKIIILAVVIAIIILAVYFLPKMNISGKATSSQNSAVKQNVVVTKENFPRYLEATSIVQEMPKDGKLILRTYNFNSGSRAWEKSYIIEKGKVNEGYDADSDAEIIISSKYIPYFGQSFCGAVQEAKTRGDFGFELKGSTAGLLWKYRSMMKYKECFGI